MQSEASGLASIAAIALFVCTVLLWAAILSG